MPKEAEKKSAEFKAGLFIILTLSMLIFSILWLRYFSVRPVMTIIAEFKNPGPITKGLAAYYQGVNIGRVSKITFSPDFKHTLVYIEFNQKLKLPKNSTAKITAQGITGQKYVDILYPDYPSSKLLVNNNIITGVTPYSLTDFQEAMGKIVKSGKLNNVFRDMEKYLKAEIALTLGLQSTLDKANIFLAKNKDNINSIISKAASSTNNLNKILTNINDITGNPQVKTGIISTINFTGLAAKNFNEISGNKEFSHNLRQTSKNILAITDNLNIITGNIKDLSSDKDIKDGLKNTFEVIGKTNKALDGLNSYNSKEGDFKGLVVDTLQSTNQAVKRFDCLSCGLSDMLNKRFLLLKLIFGQPGTALKQCQSVECKNKQ